MSRVLAVEGEAGAEARVDVAEHDQVPREEGEKAREVRPRAGVGQREAMSSSPRAVSSSLVPGPGTVRGRREKRR
jgi:hypothetical protein